MSAPPLSIVESVFIIGSMNGMVEFGNVMRDAMARQGIDGKRLAERLNVSQSLVSDWIRGEKKVPPSPDMLRRISTELHVSTRAMLEAIGYLDRDESEDAVSDLEAQVLASVRAIPNMNAHDFEILFAQLEWLRKAKTGGLDR